MSGSNMPFRRVEMNRPNRSVFTLDNIKLMDCDMGLIYPVFGRKMVPGDKFKLGAEIICRANPMIAPIMHEINIFIHYFFIPLRIMWPKPQIPETAPKEEGSWEDFFTGGVDGLLEPVKPKWIPSSPAFRTTGTLWDYCEMPVDVDPVGSYPDPWLKRGYNFVWNEYYRDQNYMDEVDLDDESLKRRCWEKDYFTTALPWQQRGIAPALPVTGFTSAEFLGIINSPNPSNPSGGSAFWSEGITTRGDPELNNYWGGAQSINAARVREWFNNNRVDLSNATTFDVSDLRLAFQTQKFLERNARAGSRYIEQLRAHYGVSPRDDRLQRPEYVGGMRTPVIVSEVLQTSSSDTTSPQGNLAGHGMSVDRQFVGSYYAQEFGVMLGLMSIMPRSVYQQGIDREWLGETRYDELLPEFVNLSEQPVFNAELFATSNATENQGVFGFNGRFDEYRVGRNKVVGKMRSGVQDSLSFWHLARHFANRPALNREFLECNPRKDFLAVPSESAFIVTVGNRCRAVRPLPVYGTPGLVDHN